jgi:hypothetical protein
MMEGNFPTTPQTEPNLVPDDDKSGIVGATICFTPQPSPLTSPRAAPDPLMKSIETEEYIGSIDARDEQVASEDGINEFELLDGVESKASIQVDELDVDDEMVGDLLKNTAKTMKNDETMEDLGCPPGGLSSLSRHGETGHAKLPIETLILDEERLQSTDNITFSRMTKSMLSHMAKLGEQDAVSVEGDASVAPSLKIDATPISTLMTLKAFWENRVLGKVGDDIVNVKEGQNHLSTDSDHQSVTSSVADSQVSSRKKNKVSVLSSIAAFIWLWLQSIVLICAYSAKKITENFCNALARNIISTVAGSQVSCRDVKSPDEMVLTEIAELTRINMRLFPDDAPVDFKPAPNSTSDSSTLDKFDPDAAGQIDKQAKRKMIGWNVAKALSVIISFAHLVKRFSSTANDFGLDSSDSTCVPSSPTSFDSMRKWEIDITQTDQTHTNLPTHYLITSLVIALLSAYVYKPVLVKKSLKREPKHFHGLWTPEEHEQFLKGFDQNGSNWKLVADFVPTRSYDQVKAHGMHWKKIGSPNTMRRSKKISIDSSSLLISFAPDVLGQLTPKSMNVTGMMPIDSTSKCREKQLADARQYAKTLKAVKSVKKESNKVKRSSRHSL